MNRGKGIILCILALVCTVFYGISVYATEQTNTASKRLIKSLSWTEYDKYLTIEKGEKEQLSVTYSPSKKINKKLKWSSSKKKIVSVNKKGVITGKKNGTAVITAKATDGSKKKIKLKVTVGKRAEELTFTNSEKYSRMYVGNTYTLKAAFTPSNTSNKKLTWSSSDEDIATVNSNGKVTAKANGKVMIMAETTDGSGVYFGEIFEVATLAKSISLSLDDSDPYHINTASHTMYASSLTTAKLKATFTPSDTSDTRLSYESSNENVARVNGDGEILTINSGISVITATTMDGSKKTAKYTVYVNSLSKDDCTFVAHRGFSEQAPANSLSAFKLAMEEGFDYVELDACEWLSREMEHSGAEILHFQSDVVATEGVDLKARRACEEYDIVLFIVTLIVLGFVASTISSLVKKAGLSSFDRLLGVVFGVVR
ncbi:MAG: CvpA family protein, partial [Lachnospiraceae bacterium]|nr:CvpA family protein [Lachnospiraceae bacterium]